MTDSVPDLSTSPTLIQRVRELDQDAWASLTKLYGPLIYGWARRNGLQSHDAADVLQNVMLSVWRGLKAFRLDRPEASFRGWLRIITRNAVYEWNRKSGSILLSRSLDPEVAGLQEHGPTINEVSSSAEDLFSGLTGQAVEVVRGTIDARTWDAFWKTTMEESPPAEVAADLNMSVAAVRQAKYRVLCRLRELLSDR